MNARRLLAVALLVLAGGDSAAAPGAASDPLTVFLADNPGVRGEELIDFAMGDSIDRVLACAYNQESGVTAGAVNVREIVGGVGTERASAELSGRRGASSTATFLVLITQDCDDRQPAPRMRPGSWLFLRDNRLAAWDVVSYGPDCRKLEERFEASDHDAMRAVGELLFRRAGRGRFRYGALRYDAWDDAFVAPTREATLSLLKARVAASPEDASAQNRLAVALFAAGDRAGALSRLERAAELDPAAPDPHRNLAILHRQRGDRAASAREEALAAAAAPVE